MTSTSATSARATIEEIDYTPAKSPGLENYGWDVYEGSEKFEDKALGPGKLVMPVATYSHSEGCSITGGYVYRGSNAVAARPLHLRRLLQRHHLEPQGRRRQGDGTEARSIQVESVSSFGQDNAGELYARLARRHDLPPDALNAICLTCATQFADERTPPERCPICEDERQYVGLDGQRWTTLEELRAERRSDVREDAGYLGVGIEPEIGIGQRLLLVETAEGNVIWDMIPLVDDAAVEAVTARGTVRAIAISHPHYYSGMVEWSRALGGVPILLHEADRGVDHAAGSGDRALVGRREGARRRADAVPARRSLPGGTVLHDPSASTLLAGDIVDGDPRPPVRQLHVELPESDPAAGRRGRADRRRARGVAVRADPRAWWNRLVPRDGNEVVRRSAERYAARVSFARLTRGLWPSAA